jgi:hypothetical protein
MIEKSLKAVPIVILLIVLAGCTQLEGNSSDVTPNLQATIEAGVAATSHARFIVPTIPATAPTIVPITEAVLVTAVPTETYAIKSALDTGQLVAQDIDQIAIAVNDLYRQVSEAGVDVEVFDEGLQETIIHVSETTALISAASADMLTFQEMYAWIVPQSESEFRALHETLKKIEQALQEVEFDLKQGDTQLIGTNGGLVERVQELSENAGLLQAQAQSWLINLDKELSLHLNTLKSIQPENVPVDKIAVFQRAFEYIDLVNQILLSEAINQAEVLKLIQLGANVAAGLKAHGGASLQNLAMSIDLISGLIAQGEFGQAKQALDGFKKGLGKRPIIPTETSENMPGVQIDFEQEP